MIARAAPQSDNSDLRGRSADQAAIGNLGDSAAALGPSSDPACSMLASVRAILVADGFRLSTIEVGISMVAPRSLVVS